MPDATQEETLTKAKFRAKFNMIPKTIEGDQAYSEACSEAVGKGYWLALDNSTWVRIGKGDTALWIQKTPATV